MSGLTGISDVLAENTVKVATFTFSNICCLMSFYFGVSQNII